jgi:hypothetical protein
MQVKCGGVFKLKDGRIFARPDSARLTAIFARSGGLKEMDESKRFPRKEWK